MINLSPNGLHSTASFKMSRSVKHIINKHLNLNKTVMDKLRKVNIQKFVEGLQLDPKRRALVYKLIEEIIDGIPVASIDEVGGIKTGYSQNDKNYPVVLDENGKMYVAVPWTDTKYALPAATSAALGGVKQGAAVAAVAADADAATIAGKVNELIASLKAAGVIA